MNKFIETYPGNGRTILTPTGYKEIIEVHKTIKYKKIKLVLNNGLILECAEHHVVITADNKEIFASNSLNKSLQTNLGNSEVISVIDLKKTEHMYDISIDSDDELYYSNGILSHNSGKTVSGGIYLVHKFNFCKELNIGIVANKGPMAREFLANTKNILIELPIWLQQGISVWNKGSIENESKMRILTDVPSSDSFRGFTISILVVDEAAHIKASVWEEFSDSIFPSQSGLAWKKNIILSTSKGMNHFYHMVKGAREETNGMNIYEVKWQDVPRYNSDGTVMTPDEFMSKVVDKHGIVYFNQNYACVSEDSLIELFNKETNDYFEARISDFSKKLNKPNYAVLNKSNLISSQIANVRDEMINHYNGLLTKHKRLFTLTPEYAKKLNMKIIHCSFANSNKVIEFKNETLSEQDFIKRDFLYSIGYDVLFIFKNEFEANKMKEIKKAVKFLNNIKIQNTYKILGCNGYEHFDNIVPTGFKDTLIFETKNEFIEVSEEHKFVINNNEIIANKLETGNELETKEGGEQIISIKKSKNYVYDVLETSTHTYYANNILNHNCEFLGSDHTLISAPKLGLMKPGEILEIYGGKLKIYVYPNKNHQYIMTVDAAKDGNDAFAVNIVDITDFNFVQVASATLQIDYLLMPEFLYEWAEMYNNPYLIIENNEGAGQSIADQMYQTYDYENLHFDKKETSISTNISKSTKKYPGFRTTTKSRKQILQTLKLFIENDKLKVNDKTTINEFLQFILINNKFQADDGAHDDMIMSLAMVFVPFCYSKNFNDMKALISNLYDYENLKDSEKISYGELLSVGSFDDGIDGDELDYLMYMGDEFI